MASQRKNSKQNIVNGTVPLNSVSAMPVTVTVAMPVAVTISVAVLITVPAPPGAGAMPVLRWMVATGKLGDNQEAGETGKHS